MMYGSGRNKGGYIRFGVRKDERHQPGGLDQAPEEHDLSTTKGSSNQDFGYMMWEGFKYFGGGTQTPWSSTTWGPIPTNGVGRGHRQARLPVERHHGFRVLGRRRRQLCLYLIVDQQQWRQSSRQIQSSDAHQRVRQELHHLHRAQRLAERHQQQSRMRRRSSSASAARRRGSVRARAARATRVRGTCSIPTWIRIRPGRRTSSPTRSARINHRAVGQIAGMITTMKSMARQGGGSYYDATNIQKLSDVFAAILTEIQGRNSVFVSASLPRQRQHAGDVPEPGVRRNVPTRCGRQPEMARQRQAVPAQVRRGDRAPFASVTPTVSTPSMQARASCPFLRAATGRPRRPFWTNWVPAKTATASDSKDGAGGAEGRRSAAAARIEPDDTSQPNGVHVRGERDDTVRLIAPLTPPVGNSVRRNDAQSGKRRYAGWRSTIRRRGRRRQQPHPPTSAP